MHQPFYFEEKDDEEDDEIQRLILSNQDYFEERNLQKITQSVSAHANLGLQLQHKRLLESDGRMKLNIVEENKNKVKFANGYQVDEDSDEEFFAEHTSLLPLRKSKSASAGFQTYRGAHGAYSKQLFSKIVKEVINDNEEITEMIDLHKGVLQFQITDETKDKSKRSKNITGCDISEFSIRSLATSPETHSQQQMESCWSAPACSNDIVFSPGSSELDEGDEGFPNNMLELLSEKKGLMRCRKESSWSAPGQFNSSIISSERDFNELRTQNEKKEDKTVQSRKLDIFTGEENNNMIPMVDDDGFIAPNFASVHDGYLPLPSGVKCHAVAENSKLPSSSFSSYFSDDEEDQTQGLFCSMGRKRQRLMHHSAAMRLCRRGSPPFAQIDLLSESEISDLEQQIASGRLVNRDRELKANYEEEKINKYSDGDTNDEYSDQYLSLDLDEIKQQKLSGNDMTCSFENEIYRQNHRPQISLHSSMPAISSSLKDSIPDKLQFRRCETENLIAGRKACDLCNHQTLKHDDSLNIQTLQNVTPSTLSDCETEDKFYHNVNTLTNRQHLSLSLASKRRQLPKTPSPEDSLEHIDIATASRERLLNVLRQTYQLLGLCREEEGGNSKISYMNCEEDPKEHRELKNECKPVLQALPSPSVLCEIQPKWPKNCCRAQALAEEQQYTLSFGMDHSANTRSMGKRRLFSIEGSYYEDNLQSGFAASNPLESDYDLSISREDQHLNELYSPENDINRNKGYIFADGAKSSSGISSSCYTSSSRSCELPDCDQQKTTPRERRSSPRLDDPILPTHRAQFEFMPRHTDELRLDRGDAVHLNEKFNDHWCFGVNLRSGQRGIFPESLIVEIDLVDEICNSVLPETNHQMRLERDTFYLTMLASIEVAHHKGNDILVQAINKVCSMYQQKDEILIPQTVLMEISFRGIHIIDKRKKDIFRCPTFDYFYSLQNISFCGAHPKELRYFGFITKHPLLPRFACHVFLSNESTQAIVEAIGRAFKRSYDEYMAFAHPTEDIFLDE